MKARSFGPLIAVAVVIGALMLPSCDKKVDSAMSGAKSATYTSRLDYKVTLDAPRANAVVTSPLTISGQVRGPWTYAGKFPIEIVDARHKPIAKGNAEVRGNWMTEGLVSFTASTSFKPATGKGFLVIRKANPSQDRSMNDSVEVPIKFG